MTVAFFAILIGLWVLYSGRKLYRNVNWEQPPVATPDTAAFKKRLKELDHIKEIFEEARDEGKLSASFMDEFHRFLDSELAAMPRQSATLPADAPEGRKLTPPSKS